MQLEQRMQRGMCMLSLPTPWYRRRQHHGRLSRRLKPYKLYSNSLLYNNSLVLVDQCSVDARIKLRRWGKYRRVCLVNLALHV
jgi:hypothetical protein